MLKKLCILLIVLASVQACSLLDKGLVSKDSETDTPIEYTNKSKPGPALIVLPGDIKSTNVTFTQEITQNNVADFGEIELSNANFKVIERSDLGPVLDEIVLAANMGDPAKVQKILKRGDFKTTKWFIKFNIVKAEKVAEAESMYDGGTIGNAAMIGGGAAGGAKGAGIAAGGAAIASTHTSQTHGVWIVGLRYKVIDANTTEQVTTEYFEEKMQVGETKSSMLGFGQESQEQVTLDTVAHRLVQQAVADLDIKK